MAPPDNDRSGFGQTNFVAATVLALACLLTIAPNTEAASERRLQPARADQVYGDQKGCYWARGQRHCSQYCYWEVDGRRYCQTRESLAWPSGNPDYRKVPPEPPIYGRAPHRRQSGPDW